MLLMIEKGVPVEYKGKTLSEIEIDTQYADEHTDVTDEANSLGTKTLKG